MGGMKENASFIFLFLSINAYILFFSRYTIRNSNFKQEYAKNFYRQTKDFLQ